MRLYKIAVFTFIALMCVGTLYAATDFYSKWAQHFKTREGLECVVYHEATKFGGLQGIGLSCNWQAWNEERR